MIKKSAAAHGFHNDALGHSGVKLAKTLVLP